MKKALRPLFCILVFLPLLLSCGSGGGGSGSNDLTFSSPSGDSNSFDNPANNNTSIQTQDVTLSWDAPTTNADGTPLTDLAGYRVYFGQGSGKYRYKNDVGNVRVCTIGGLTSGTWCFVVTAYDTSGNESDYSNEVCVNLQ